MKNEIDTKNGAIPRGSSDHLCSGPNIFNDSSKAKARPICENTLWSGKITTVLYNPLSPITQLGWLMHISGSLAQQGFAVCNRTALWGHSCLNSTSEHTSGGMRASEERDTKQSQLLVTAIALLTIT